MLRIRLKDVFAMHERGHRRTMWNLKTMIPQCLCRSKDFVLISIRGPVSPVLGPVLT